MVIKCILIDDEPFALNLLEDDLSMFPNVEVLAKFTSTLPVREYLRNHEIDLIFTDIQMPEILGTQFIRSLENIPLVVFTTAYHQYAVEGFELNVVDYLTKPIRRERLGVALDKVSARLELAKNSTQSPISDYFTVNVEYQKVKILVDDVSHVEGLKDYVKIHLVNRAQPLLTRMNLRGMAEVLSKFSFLRIHNSYIVNTSKISAIHTSKLFLGAVSLPIGKKYAEAIRKFNS
ncbi:LytR/AlgR family response regulator transcription factor [Sphingobacterium chungjuense]|uniref:LytR/AlgR family response regulator transcription factor n=1 Tax=Sphingobacterium chungjuense TaxID=2675553 RepID=UPI0014086DF8|nr:LytTR family DNA-binding domain-containing protein [Sphingobacterium chungjuense]